MTSAPVARTWAEEYTEAVQEAASWREKYNSAPVDLQAWWEAALWLDFWGEKASFLWERR